MDEIARHAGVGVGTVYRRFHNRDEIIAALFEQRMRDYVALGDAALADPDPWAGFVEFLESSLSMQAADRGLKELLMGDGRALETDRARARARDAAGRAPARPRAGGRRAAGRRRRPRRPGGVADGRAGDRLHQDAAPDLWRRYLALLLDGLRRAAAARSRAPRSSRRSSTPRCHAAPAVAAEAFKRARSPPITGGIANAPQDLHPHRDVPRRHHGGVRRRALDPEQSSRVDGSLYVMPGGFVAGLDSGQTLMMSVALVLSDGSGRKWLTGMEQDRVRRIVDGTVADIPARRLVTVAGRQALAARCTGTSARPGCRSSRC